MQISILAKLQAYVQEPLLKTLLVEHNSVAELQKFFEGGEFTPVGKE